MKILSWNIRGLGNREKRRNIKDTVRREKVDVEIFQETKRESINWTMIGALWGVRFKDWDF